MGTTSEHRRDYSAIRLRLAGLLIINTIVVLVVSQASTHPSSGVFVAAVLFWGGLFLFPHAFNRKSCSPRVTISSLYFLSAW